MQVRWVRRPSTLGDFAWETKWYSFEGWSLSNGEWVKRYSLGPVKLTRTELSQQIQQQQANLRPAGEQYDWVGQWVWKTFGKTQSWAFFGYKASDYARTLGYEIFLPSKPTEAPPEAGGCLSDADILATLNCIGANNCPPGLPSRDLPACADATQARLDPGCLNQDLASARAYCRQHPSGDGPNPRYNTICWAMSKFPAVQADFSTRAACSGVSDSGGGTSSGGGGGTGVVIAVVAVLALGLALLASGGGSSAAT